MIFMDEPGPRRHGTLLAVAIFHVGLILALAMITKTLRVPVREMGPIELLALPPGPTSRAPKEPLLPHPLRREAMATMAPRPSTDTLPQSIDPADSAGPPIDWASEAEKIAAVPSPEFQTFGGPPAAEPNAPSRSIFEDRPAHHAGEQVRTDDGRWVVFVSDYCYQMTNSFVSPNALEAGAGMQTYCLRKSHQPRADLFEQLAAYQKYHGSR